MFDRSFIFLFFFLFPPKTLDFFNVDDAQDLGFSAISGLWGEKKFTWSATQQNGSQAAEAHVLLATLLGGLLSRARRSGDPVQR